MQSFLLNHNNSINDGASKETLPRHYQAVYARGDVPAQHIHNLLLQARKRWLKAHEVLDLLTHYRRFDLKLSEEAPVRPPGGSLYLFDRKNVRYFRKDGYNWKKKKDGKTVKETHEKLKVDNVDALNCYYAHSEEDDRFQRRSYWLLEGDDNTVLVHYLEVEGDPPNLARAQRAATTPATDIATTNIFRGGRSEAVPLLPASQQNMAGEPSWSAGGQQQQRAAAERSRSLPQPPVDGIPQLVDRVGHRRGNSADAGGQLTSAAQPGTSLLSQHTAAAQSSRTSPQQHKSASQHVETNTAWDPSAQVHAGKLGGARSDGWQQRPSRLHPTSTSSAQLGRFAPSPSPAVAVNAQQPQQQQVAQQTQHTYQYRQQAKSALQHHDQQYPQEQWAQQTQQQQQQQQPPQPEQQQRRQQSQLERQQQQQQQQQQPYPLQMQQQAWQQSPQQGPHTELQPKQVSNNREWSYVMNPLPQQQSPQQPQLMRQHHHHHQQQSSQWPRMEPAAVAQYAQQGVLPQASHALNSTAQQWQSLQVLQQPPLPSHLGTQVGTQSAPQLHRHPSPQPLHHTLGMESAGYTAGVQDPARLLAGSTEGIGWQRSMLETWNALSGRQGSGVLLPAEHDIIQGESEISDLLNDAPDFALENVDEWLPALFLNTTQDGIAAESPLTAVSLDPTVLASPGLTPNSTASSGPSSWFDVPPAEAGGEGLLDVFNTQSTGLDAQLMDIQFHQEALLTKIDSDLLLKNVPPPEVREQAEAELQLLTARVEALQPAISDLQAAAHTDADMEPSSSSAAADDNARTSTVDAVALTLRNLEVAAAPAGASTVNDAQPLLAVVAVADPLSGKARGDVRRTVSNLAPRGLGIDALREMGEDVTLATKVLATPSGGNSFAHTALMRESGADLTHAGSGSPCNPASPANDEVTSPARSAELMDASRWQFQIADFNPEWDATSGGAKVLIVGQFVAPKDVMSDATSRPAVKAVVPPAGPFWCIFGEKKVSAELIAAGVIRCRAPEHQPGRARLLLLGPDGLPCSEEQTFEFRGPPVASSPSAAVAVLPPHQRRTHEQRRTPPLNKEDREATMDRAFQLVLIKTLLENGGAALVKLDMKHEASDMDLSDAGGEPITDKPSREVIIAAQNKLISMERAKLERLLPALLHRWLRKYVLPALPRKLPRGGQKSRLSLPLNRKDAAGFAALHAVAALDYDWAVATLVVAGADVSVRDRRGRMPLHWAAARGRERVVAALLAAGAIPGSLTRHGSRGCSPADLAAAAGHHGIAAFLAEAALNRSLAAMSLVDRKRVSMNPSALVQRRSGSDPQMLGMRASEPASLSAAAAGSGMDAVGSSEQRVHEEEAADTLPPLPTNLNAHQLSDLFTRKRTRRNWAGAMSSEGEQDSEVEAASTLAKAMTAASTIQSAYRNHKLQQEASEQQHAAATKIQAAFRTYQERKLYLGLRDRIVHLQANVRAYLQRTRLHRRSTNALGAPSRRGRDDVGHPRHRRRRSSGHLNLELDGRELEREEDELQTWERKDRQRRQDKKSWSGDSDEGSPVRRTPPRRSPARQTAVDTPVQSAMEEGSDEDEDVDNDRYGEAGDFSEDTDNPSRQDRSEAMLEEAVRKIQAIVRCKQTRAQYLRLRSAALTLQSEFRGKAAKKKQKRLGL